MREVKIGCGIVAGVTMLCLVVLLAWTLIPPRLNVPPRQYPPDNAYTQIAAIAFQLAQLKASSPRLKELSQRAEVVNGALTPHEHQEYARYVEPLLQAYRKHLDQPSTVVMTYDPNSDPSFRANALLRELVRAEGYFIRWALANDRQAEAIERATALAQLGNQISQDGALIHYLVGQAVRMMALVPVQQNLPRIRQRAALERLLNWAKQEERKRPKLETILQMEQYIGRTMLMQAHKNPTPADPAAAEWWERYTLFAKFMVKVAAVEYESAMEQLKAYAVKPAWQRQPSDYPRVRHPWNKSIFPIFDEFFMRYETMVALTRLLGCVAAVRLHKMHTGRYPASLEQLNLGELTIDPFTGRSFVYRVDARKGFLIYSVGLDRVDNGGRFHYDPWLARGDIVPARIQIPAHLKGANREAWPLADPVWLR